VKKSSHGVVNRLTREHTKKVESEEKDKKVESEEKDKKVESEEKDKKVESEEKDKKRGRCKILPRLSLLE